MNWIISKSKKMQFHTDLDVLFKPIYDEIEKYNWILSDIEYNGTASHVNSPINHQHDFFILSPDEFKRLISIDVQIYWGIILAVPIGKEIIALNEDEQPFAEGNPLIWEDGNIQHPDAVMEIACFDSGYTIVKFKDEAMSNRFKAYFDEAESLQAFNARQK
jgi:hypothetical protein